MPIEGEVSPRRFISTDMIVTDVHSPIEVVVVSIWMAAVAAKAACVVGGERSTGHGDEGIGDAV